jgi:hypothetical protein
MVLARDAPQLAAECSEDGRLGAPVLQEAPVMRTTTNPDALQPVLFCAALLRVAACTPEVGGVYRVALCVTDSEAAQSDLAFLNLEVEEP